MVKRTPTILEFLHSPPGTYPEFERTYSSRPLIDAQSPRVQRNVDALMGPVPHMVPRNMPLPVAVTAQMYGQPMPEQSASSIVRGLAGIDRPEAPHVSLSDVALPPMFDLAGQIERAAPPQAPWGMAPSQPLPGGGHFDSGIAPPDAGRPVVNAADMRNSAHPLRPPGAFGSMASPAPAQQMGLADWVLRAVIGGH